MGVGEGGEKHSQILVAMHTDHIRRKSNYHTCVIDNSCKFPLI
jgi:hypothetical protein